RVRPRGPQREVRRPRRDAVSGRRGLVLLPRRRRRRGRGDPSMSITANQPRQPRSRMAVQSARIVAGAILAARFYPATEHATVAIPVLRGVCIAGLLACVATAIQVMRGGPPQPAKRTPAALPAGPPPAARHMLPAKAVRPALLTATTEFT